MKNQPSINHRLGSRQVFDPLTQISINIPADYRIYNRLPGIWIGGAEDGHSYLHIERISARALEMPTALAGGDLDITVYPSGLGQPLGEGIMKQNVFCKLRTDELMGCWLRTTISDDYHYLILVAAKENASLQNLQATATTIAMAMMSQVPKKMAIAC